MNVTEFTEISAAEFSRRIAVARYKYNFLVLDEDKRFSVLQIGEYEICTLQRIDGAIYKMLTPLAILFEGKGNRFFIEPRFDGVTVSRLVLKAPLRVGDICAVYRKPSKDDQQQPCLAIAYKKESTSMWFLSANARVSDLADVMKAMEDVESVANVVLRFPLNSVIEL